MERSENDAHTAPPFGNVDEQDSWEHFVDTYLEGYGINDQCKLK